MFNLKFKVLFDDIFLIHNNIILGNTIRGEILNYRSVITNTGSQNVTNVVFSDVHDANLTFVSGSVKIDNVNYPSYNPINSFALPDIAPGGSVTVDFQALVN